MLTCFFCGYEVCWLYQPIQLITRLKNLKRYIQARKMDKLSDLPAAVSGGHKLIFLMQHNRNNREWHNRKIVFTSSCCHRFIPCCIQIQFWQQCVTESTETAIHPEDQCFQGYLFFIVFYCASLSVNQILLHEIFFSFCLFTVKLLIWEQRAAHLTAERL